MPTAERLLLRIERMKRSAKRLLVLHGYRVLPFQNLSHTAGDAQFEFACLRVEGFEFLV